MFGALIAVLSSATFGLNDAITRRGVISGSPFQAIAISIPMGMVLFVLFAAIGGELGAIGGLGGEAIFFLGLSGIVHFVLGRYCNYRALQAIGANLAAPIQGTSTVVSLLVALAFLGERLTVLAMIGVALTLLGPSLLIRRRRAARSAGAAAAPAGAFVPRYVEGYLFSALSAVFYGLSPIFARAGLLAMDGRLPLLGGLVAYIAATAAFILVIAYPRRMVEVLATPREAARWFAMSGVTVTLAQLTRFVALSLAPVTIVAPIMRLTTIFRMFFGWTLNRSFESYERNVFAAVALSLIGTMALAFDVGTLADLLSLPQDVVALLAWTWP